MSCPAPPCDPPRPRRARLPLLDWIRLGLLAVGLVFVATGLLPRREAMENLTRIAPLLLFLGSVIVLAGLAREARVFDVIATRLAIVGGGDYRALFLLCVVFASATTIFLNLDTTAVLLTPVFLALAPRARIAALPLVMCTIWLCNTASVLLPVSNLTNLLAGERTALSAWGFAARMALPQLLIIVVTMVFLWVGYWRRSRRGHDRYQVPDPVVLTSRVDRSLFRVAGLGCVLFIVAIPIVGHAIGWAALLAMSVVVLAFAVLDRRRLGFHLIPWQLLVLVTGLFLVVPTICRVGLAEVIGGLIGTDNGLLGGFRAAVTGAGLSNLLNNLPAYTAGEAAIAEGNHRQLLALLIGTNAGSIITPWASLATLLCLEICRGYGLVIPLRRFMLTGLGLATCAIIVGVVALPA